MTRIAEKKRSQGHLMVFTNGCFDLLHVGHVSYLEQARKLGDYLVVAVNSDASVRRLKGPHRPINHEKARARVLSALQVVDFVVIFRSQRVTSVLKSLKPEIYVKGGDYTPESLHSEERSAIQSYHGKIKILPLWKGYSTTRTIQKINL
jgi:rfaE bifunctional protein nucleotidyltransferase chain/domain